MIKYTAILIFLFFLPVAMQAQAKEPVCADMIRAGMQQEEAGNLDAALKSYLNALICDSKLAGEVGPRINRVFTRIQEQKAEAQRNEELAENRRKQAVAAQKIAEAKTREAEASALAVRMQQAYNVDQNAAMRFALEAYHKAPIPEAAEAVNQLFSDPGIHFYQKNIDPNRESGLGGTHSVVNALTYSADGKYLLLAENRDDRDGPHHELSHKVNILPVDKTAQSELTTPLEGHKSDITSMSILDTLLVSGDQEGRVILWNWKKDLANWQRKVMIKEFDMASEEERNDPMRMKNSTNVPFPFAISRVVLSSDGKKILAVTQQGRIKVWLIAPPYDSEPVLLMEKKDQVLKPDPIYSAAFIPATDSILWSGYALNKSGIGLVAIDSSFDSNIYNILDFVILEDGLIVAGGKDQNIYVCNSQGKSLLILPGHNASVTAISANSDGSQILSGDNNGVIKWWDFENAHFDPEDPYGDTPELLGTFYGHSQAITSLAFQPEGQYFSSASQDGSVKIWELNSFLQPRRYYLHEDKITSLTLLPGSDEVISSSMDGSVLRWNLPDGTITGKISARDVPEVAFDPSARVLEKQINPQGVLDLAVTPDGKQALLIRQNGSLELRRVDGKAAPKPIKGSSETISNLVFHPDGDKFYTGSTAGRVQVWSLEKAAPVSTLAQWDTPVSTLSISPDGQWLLAGRTSTWHFLEDQSPPPIGYVWNTSGPKLKYTLPLFPDRQYLDNGFPGSMYFPGHGSDIVSAAWSADGALLLTAGADGFGIIHHAKTGKWKQDLGVESKGNLKWWDAYNLFPDREGERRPGSDYGLEDGSTVKLFPERICHRGQILHTVFSADKKLCLTAGADRRVVMWDVASGYPLFTLDELPSVPTQVIFSASDEYIIVGLESGTIGVWMNPFFAWRGY